MIHVCVYTRSTSTSPIRSASPPDSTRTRKSPKRCLALALALRLDCPIFVDDSVLKSSKLAATVSDKVNNEELKRWLEGLNDEDLGRYKM